MKRTLLIALSCISILIVLSAVVQNSSGDAYDVVKIGVFEPQSGDNSAIGRQGILGIQYANYIMPTVQIGGKAYTVALVYADNKPSNDEAASAAQTLVSAGCSIVLGSYSSGVSISASETFGNACIPVIGATCAHP